MGSAEAVVIVGADIMVGGELAGIGEIRRATGPDGVFEPVGKFEHPVVDLGVGPDGIVVALSGAPTAGFTVSACADPSAGLSCWRELASELPAVGDELMVHSLLVEQDRVWVAAAHHDNDGPTTRGALFRIDCE
jgi:hypothetical protein